MTQNQASAIRVDYDAITTTTELKATLDTSQMFDGAHRRDTLSPIDQFIKNTNAVNIIWLPQQSVSPELASIALLGYVSAVESYMRAVIRATINADETTREIVSVKSISYAAALHHKKEILPEALLEDISFASPENIKKTINNYLGFDAKYQGMEIYFDEFEKISQIRHCCTHRFGKLGSKNAVALGLTAHNKLLEKPLKLNTADLENISDTLRNLVKNLNNTLFKLLLERTVKGGRTSAKTDAKVTQWKWNYNEDKGIFSKYYRIFASKNDSIPSPSQSEMYNRFMKASQKKPKEQTKRNKGEPQAEPNIDPPAE